MPKKEIKIVTIIGARPQFIKAAMVSRSFKRHNIKKQSPAIKEIIVHTGQHYDMNMSQVFFDQLKIPNPIYHLEVGSGNHGQMTGKMLPKIEEVLQKEDPDWVLVYGDTNSTLAGALAAVKLHIPIGHVEAGLRSFNRRMPEEINRVVTDHISNMLFCPTEIAVNNLKKEGFKNIYKPTNFYPVKSLPGKTKSLFQKGEDHLTAANNPIVMNVGDVMHEAFLAFRSIALLNSTILSDLELQGGNYCLATVHRQENTDDLSRLYNIFFAFDKLALKECPFIIPLHPRTRKNLKMLKPTVIQNPHVLLISPINYVDMVALEINAKVILTDSGGMQKEAFFASVPCITLRDETEWVETIETGWNHLSGVNTDNIVTIFNSINNIRLGEPPNFYGEGNASKLILKHLILASNFEFA